MVVLAIVVVIVSITIIVVVFVIGEPMIVVVMVVVIVRVISTSWSHTLDLCASGKLPSTSASGRQRAHRIRGTCGWVPGTR